MIMVDEFGSWKLVMKLYAKDLMFCISYDFGGRLYIMYIECIS